MVFTIIYLSCNRMPRATFKEEVEATSPDVALLIFINNPAHDNDFIAAIVECPASKVHYTKERL